jgi:hypothetical protein
MEPGRLHRKRWPPSIGTRGRIQSVCLAAIVGFRTGFAYANEQLAQGQPVEVSGYTVQMMRDTLENWQSEFLQLIWQVAGLAMLLHLGSPQSKEGDDRMEAKIDAILLAVEPKKGERLLDEIDRQYEGRHTDKRFVEQLEKTASR